MSHIFGQSSLTHLLDTQMLFVSLAPVLSLVVYHFKNSTAMLLYIPYYSVIFMVTNPLNWLTAATPLLQSSCKTFDSSPSQYFCQSFRQELATNFILPSFLLVSFLYLYFFFLWLNCFPEGSIKTPLLPKMINCFAIFSWLASQEQWLADLPQTYWYALQLLPLLLIE